MGKLRSLIQIVGLILFVFLMVKGKLMLWMGLTVVSLLLALLFGRFFCGWICPINSVIHVVEIIKTRFGLKRVFADNHLSWIGYVLLCMMISVIILTRVRGAQIPFLPILGLLAVIATLVWSERVWHQRLCPFGLLFRKIGHFSIFNIKKAQNCSNCGLCVADCPGGALYTVGDELLVDKENCLLCLRCQDVCKREGMVYQKTTFGL